MAHFVFRDLLLQRHNLSSSLRQQFDDLDGRVSELEQVLPNTSNITKGYMATRFLCRMLSRSLTIKQQPFIGITCPLSRGMSTTYTTFSYKISPALYNVEIGCDLKHWRILVRKYGALFNKSRDEVINFYVKTLAAGIGVSEEEAKMKLYAVFTSDIYSFGANISIEDAKKLQKSLYVLGVKPDCYLDVENKIYQGEPVINGQVGPYDDKYYAHIRCAEKRIYTLAQQEADGFRNPNDIDYTVADDTDVDDTDDDVDIVVRTESDGDGFLRTDSDKDDEAPYMGPVYPDDNVGCLHTGQMKI